MVDKRIPKRPPHNEVMELQILVGSRSETVVFPDRSRPDRIGRTAGDELDIPALLRRACEQPIASPPLADFLRGAKNLLIVVNDATRATPTGVILEAIRDELKTVPEVKIVVATGLHRAPTGEEYRAILGAAHNDFRAVCFAHNGHQLDELEWIDGGQEKILINPALLGAERVLIINSVEPHFFAGYTGGRKSLLPGLAGYPSVEASHAGAVSELAAPLRVADNPVRRFIQRNTNFIDSVQVFAVQVVLDRFDKIAQAFAGNIDPAFSRACAGAYKFYTMPVERRYDIVLALVPSPLDINLYQTEKAWEHAKYALKPGGILICVSACHEGIGSEFYRQLAEKYPDFSRWLSLAEQPYEMGLHKLVRTARMRNQGELWLVSDLDSETVRRFWYEPKTSVQKAVDEALAIRGRDALILIVDDAALTVPVFAE